MRYLLLILLLPTFAFADSANHPSSLSTFTFALWDAADPKLLLSGATHASGDSQISCDGGAYADSAFTEISSTGTYTVTLTATQLSAKACVLKIDDQAGAAFVDDLIRIYPYTSGVIRQD